MTKDDDAAVGTEKRLKEPDPKIMEELNGIGEFISFIQLRK